MDPAAIHIAPEGDADAAPVIALIDAAFGPGRHAKAAERLREGAHPLADLSLVARSAGQIIGTARLWPILIGAAPALLLGPLAVDETRRGAGLGRELVRRACAGAAGAGHVLVLLVGDEAFFREAGFAAAPARRVVMPGPVDLRRVLVRALVPGAADALSGPVRARP